MKRSSIIDARRKQVTSDVRERVELSFQIVDRIHEILVKNEWKFDKESAICKIYAESEQDSERTRKNFLTVRQEGNRSVRRNMSHYNFAEQKDGQE